MTSTSTRHATSSRAAWIASLSGSERQAFLKALSDEAVQALPFVFEFWAHDHQRPPDGDWRTWVVIGGRGAGKTRAGAEWVRAEVEGARPLDQGRAKSVALIGETIDQTREVMVFGESGILQCSPPDRRPEWQSSRNRLVWPNGAVAQIFSAHNPESLRGPQFDAAWVDELAKWPRAEETWDMLQFGLRLGDTPRQVVTTTPRSVPILKQILDSPSTVTSHAPTEANRANLAENFLDEVRSRYAGTRLARQELDGVMLTDVDGALWSTGMLEAARVRDIPPLDRIVVAVDPPAGGGKRSDACGIVVAGAVTQGPPETWRAYVLEDATLEATSPSQWAAAVMAAHDRNAADRIVAEVNQGGAMVETVLRQHAPLAPYKAVRATEGKVARAEPIAALYEQGRVKHALNLDALEDQMCLITARGYQASGSPDRVDALVWALHELMIGPAKGYARPTVRSL